MKGGFIGVEVKSGVTVGTANKATADSGVLTVNSTTLRLLNLPRTSLLIANYSLLILHCSS
jgi:hypothetical protein